MRCTNRKCKKDVNCQDNHTFSLRPTSTGTYYRSLTKILLCPSLDRDGNIAHSFPVFNKDQKTHTPAFCLDVDKNYSPEQEQEMLFDHIRKVKDSLNSQQEIWLPKPNNKNKFCSVCKDNYEDYKQHIQSPAHKKCIQKSRFNKCVKQMCDMFKQNQPYPKQKTETIEQYIIDDDESAVMRKVRKVQTTLESPQEKLHRQASSTNISLLNRQFSHGFQGYSKMYNMLPNLPFPMYFPNMPYFNHLPFNMPANFYQPQLNYPYMFPFSQPPMFNYQNINPILISDD